MIKQPCKGETGYGRLFSHNYFKHGGSSRKWAFEELPTLVTLTLLKILFLVMRGGGNREWFNYAPVTTLNAAPFF